MGVRTSESPVETAALSVLPHDDCGVGWHCRITMVVSATNRVTISDGSDRASMEVSNLPVNPDGALPCSGNLAEFPVVWNGGMPDIRHHDR